MKRLLVATLILLTASSTLANARDRQDNRRDPHPAELAQANNCSTFQSTGMYSVFADTKSREILGIARDLGLTAHRCQATVDNQSLDGTLLVGDDIDTYQAEEIIKTLSENNIRGYLMYCLSGEVKS